MLSRQLEEDLHMEWLHRFLLLHRQLLIADLPLILHCRTLIQAETTIATAMAMASMVEGKLEDSEVED
jgi:hypothetical protein